MAVFEESEGVNSASNAVQAAIQMQQALKKMRPEMLARGWPEFFSGTGINTGDSVIGNVGAKNQLSRTVLGDSVNLAARVESLSKEGHESHILFTEFTLANLTENNQSPFQYKFLMETKVKGKSSPVKIYEIDQSHLEV